MGGEDEEEEDEDAEHEQDPSHHPQEVEDPQDPSVGNLGMDGSGLSQRQALNQDPTICIIPPPFPVSASISTPSIQQQRPLPSKPQTVDVTRPQIPLVNPSQLPLHTMGPMSPYGQSTSEPSIPFPQSSSVQTRPQTSGVQPSPNSQVMQSLAHLTNLAQSLVTTCSTLVEFFKAQAEESRVRLEEMRRVDRYREEDVDARESMDKKEKARLATSILADPAGDEQVKQAAADYLRRLFAD